MKSQNKAVKRRNSSSSDVSPLVLFGFQQKRAWQGSVTPQSVEGNICEVLKGSSFPALNKKNQNSSERMITEGNGVEIFLAAVLLRFSPSLLRHKSHSKTVGVK